MLVGGKRLYVTKGVPPVVPAPLSSLSLVEMFTNDPVKAMPVFQRKAGTNKARPAVVCNITGGNGTPHIQARVVKVQADNSRVPLTGWEDIVSPSVSNDGLTVAGLGPDMDLGPDYALDVRDGANHAMTDEGAQKWGVGVVGAAVGQSNQVTALSGPHNPMTPHGVGEWDYHHATGYKVATLFGNKGAFPPSTTLNSGSGVFANGGGATFTMRTLAAGLEATHGKKVPVGLITWAFNSNSLAQLGVGGGNGGIWTNSGTTSGSIGVKSPGYIFCGDYEFVMVNQGEQESNTISRNQRKLDLIDFCEDQFAIVAPFGREKHQLAICFVVPGAYDGAAANMENVRSAAIDLDAHAVANGWTKVRSMNFVDMDTATAKGGDGGLHYNGMMGEARRRQAHQMMWAAGCVSYAARGPRMVSGTRSGDVATITVAHDGGNTLQSANNGPLTGFTVLDNNGAAVTATITIATASTLSVACPPGTAYPIRVGFAMGKRYSTDNLPTDNAKYPFVDNGSGGNIFTGSDPLTGLPMMHTPADQMITVA
jgi:hypothetical protein